MCVFSIEFRGADKKVIKEITSSNSGKWFLFKPGEGEDIVSIQAIEYFGFMKALGFMTIKKWLSTRETNQQLFKALITLTHFNKTIFSYSC